MKNTTKDYFTIGVEKFNIGDFKQALEYFQAAIEQNPYLQQGYMKLSEVYLSLNDERNAKKTLYRLLSINPDNRNAQRLLCQTQKGSNLCIDKVVAVNSEITSTKSKVPLTGEITKVGCLDFRKCYHIGLPCGYVITLRICSPSYCDKNERYFGRIVGINHSRNIPVNAKRPNHLIIPPSVIIEGNHITITTIGRPGNHSPQDYIHLAYLTDVDIPPTVTRIEGCYFLCLKKVTFWGKRPPEIDRDSFTNYNNLRRDFQVFVPVQYIQNYRNYYSLYFDPKQIIPF